MSNNVPEDKKIEPQETLLKYKEYSAITNEFAKFAHNFIHENIGRVDQKATIIFSFLSVIFIFTPNNEIIKILKINFHFWHILIYIMIISFAASIIFSFLTIFPRLRGGQSYNSRTLLPRFKAGEFSVTTYYLMAL